jgi:hypothetical protein
LSRRVIPSTDATFHKSIRYFSNKEEEEAATQAAAQAARMAKGSGNSKNNNKKASSDAMMVADSDLTGDGGFDVGPDGYVIVQRTNPGVGVALFGAYNASALGAGPRRARCVTA